MRVRMRFVYKGSYFSFFCLLCFDASVLTTAGGSLIYSKVSTKKAEG